MSEEENLFERLEEEVERVRALGPWNSMCERCYERCVEEVKRDCLWDLDRPYDICVEEEKERCVERCLEEYGG
jgi:hypothetical protein